MTNKRIKIGGLLVAGCALLALLAYNFVHTGGLLARYVDPWYIGYTAAFGIELAVVALSVAIGTQKYHGLGTGRLWAVLAAVVIVSFLANMEQGHLKRYGADLTWAALGTIDWIQVVIGLAATGLVSLIVMSMSEVGGQFLIQLSAKEGKGKEHGQRLDPIPGSLNGQKKTDQAKWYLINKPSWTQARIAEAIPCNPSTVHEAKKQLAAAGEIPSPTGPGSVGDNGSGGL